MAGIRECLLGCLVTQKELFKQRMGIAKFLSSPEKEVFESYIEFINIVSHDIRSFKCIYYFENNRYEEELCINPLWSPMELFTSLNEQLLMLKDKNLKRIELQYLDSFYVLYEK